MSSTNIIGNNNTAVILDGTATKQKIVASIKQEVNRLKREQGVVPGLATILLGDNPAAQSYVRLKVKTALACGFYEVQVTLTADITETELLAVVDKYNNDEKIHGILVQLPLPPHIDTEKIVLAISNRKDVDGFHPTNLGYLMRGLAGESTIDKGFISCTPLGIVRLLQEYHIQTSGRHIVIVGRSNLVGKPLANLLLQKSTSLYGNATVTLIHTGTINQKHFTKSADILIVAAGSCELIKDDWIKPGTVVVDVGIHQTGTRYSDTLKKDVPILKGDVDFDAVKKKASYITPVPGGVGPMTIACLMQNTLTACKRMLTN